ncbi:MAG: hypothetical protein UCN50_03710, partial [Anaerotignum sp.]|uniref:hypothetical protein n=1 Tax=Anaerotignum sp. TaxID=2039241 RepID=UPI002E76E6C6
AFSPAMNRTYHIFSHHHIFVKIYAKYPPVSFSVFCLFFRNWKYFFLAFLSFPVAAFPSI